MRHKGGRILDLEISQRRFHIIAIDRAGFRHHRPERHRQMRANRKEFTAVSLVAEAHFLADQATELQLHLHHQRLHPAGHRRLGGVAPFHAHGLVKYFHG